MDEAHPAQPGSPMIHFDGTEFPTPEQMQQMVAMLQDSGEVRLAPGECVVPRRLLPRLLKAIRDRWGCGWPRR